MWRTTTLAIACMLAAVPSLAGQGGAIISKDSLEFRIPIHDPDEMLQWNAAPAGTEEYAWLVAIDYDDGFNPGHYGYTLIGMVYLSADAPVRQATVAEMVAECDGSLTLSEEADVLPNYVFPDGYRSTFVDVGYANGAIVLKVTKRDIVEDAVFSRPDTLAVRYLHRGEVTYSENLEVDNQKDPRESRALEIDGQFSPDEYAIYQAVIGQYEREERVERLYILTPSVSPGPARETDRIANHLKYDSDPETIADYYAKWDSIDLSPLWELGYTVASPDSLFYLETPGTEFHHTVRLTRIGFNSSRTQALVSMATDCWGVKCGRNQMILLERVGTEWLVKKRV